MRNFTLFTKLLLTFSFLLLTAFGFGQIAQRGVATTATATSTSILISKPTGIIVGDIMIANIAIGGNNTTAVTSSGWTSIDGRSLAGMTARYGAVLYKIAVATDLVATNYTFTLGAGTDSVAGAIIAFSGVDTTTPFDVTPGTINIANSATVTATAITTANTNTAIIMLGQAAANTPTWSNWSTTSPGTLTTELFDLQNTSNTKTSIGGAWATKAAAGTTGNGTATLSASERNGGILLALRAAIACTTYSLTSTAASSPTCAGATATVTLSSTVTANLPTGSYTVTYDLGAPNAATSNTATMTVTTAGTGTFPTSALANAGSTLITVTKLTKGSCNSTISLFNTATTTVISGPSVAAGSALADICKGGSTVVLGGSFGGSATAAVWSDGGVGGTFADNTGTTPGTTTWTPPPAYTGTATLTLTTSGGTCGTIAANKTQIVTAPTAAAGSALSTICQGATTVALGGSYGGTATSAVWSDGGVGGTFADNTGTTPSTTTWTPPAAYTGTATLTLTTAGGACGTITASKTQVVSLAPTVDAGVSLAAMCQGGTSVALGGSYGGGATSAVWSDGGVGGTFSNNTGTTPSTTTWTPPATYTGTVTLTLTTAGGGCGAITASKTLAVNATPTATAGSVLAAICQGGTTAALGGSIGGSAILGIWSSSAGGTFANNTGTTPGTATWTPPAAYTGTAVLTLTTSGGTCGTTTATKNQTVSAGTPPTTATVGSAQTIYGAKLSAALGGNTPTVGTGAWSLVSGPSSGSPVVVATATFSAGTSGTSTATVSAYGTYLFRWTITNGACGTSFADVNVTYLPFKDPEYTLTYENFDNNDGAWISSGATGSWGYTNTASSVHSGEGGFWGVNTTTSLYPNNAMTYLTSPTIVTTGYKNIKLYLDVRYKTDIDTDDGMQIQYSTNNGTTWLVLGDNSAPTTWYTQSNVNALSGTSATTPSTNGWNNNNNSTAVAPVSQFEERSIQTSVLDNIAQLKFRAVFASDNGNQDAGVAIDNVMIKGDPIVAFANPTNGPGSINSNLKLWLKANTGTSTNTDGTSLATWNDQAKDNNSIGITGKSPVYRNNATRNINFNPVVDFTAASTQHMKGKGGYWSQDYYVVVKTNGAIDNTDATRQVPISGRTATATFNVDGTALGLGRFTARYQNEMVSHNINSIPTSPPTDTKSYGRAYTSTTDSYNQQTIIFNIKTNSNGTSTEIYKNGKRIDNTAGQTVATDQVTFTGTMNFSEFNNLQYNLGVGRFTLGGNAATSYLDGRMTEVVSYSNPKTTLEQQKIQSYLGIKNGVTLHATGSTTADDLCDVNYIDSSGSTIWDATTNSGYNYDIAGIGRDDTTLLNQKQSKTENTVSDISIGLGALNDVNTNNTNTFANDKNYLVWGNNHGTLAAQTPITVNMSSGITPSLTSNVSFTSVGRTWKVVENGTIASTKVSIPTTMLSATLSPPGSYLMFISSSPVFNPTAEYRVMTVNGSNLETDYDFNGTKYITFGFAPEYTFVRCIKFDGINDYLDSGNVLNLNTSFTVSAWVNRNSVSQTILSKRDDGFTTGYDLSINATGRAEMSWYVGATKKTIISSAVIPTGIWHHVGVTFDGTTAKMYIDGINTVSTPLAGVPTATTQSFLVAAAGTTPTAFFNGSLDEVRVWNVALTAAQFRYVMNQEILSNSTATNGSIVPNTITLNDISAIPWANLSAYYPMSTYTYTNAKDISNNNYTAALKNLTTVDSQTAPLPYVSNANGAWQTIGTWTNSSVQDLPNSVSIEDNTKTIDWNIVVATHDITSEGDKTVLGLYVGVTPLGVTTASKLTATTASPSQTTGSKIEVSHYLKLNGKIDLVGRSQLVQSLGSDLDITSSGSVERDQQGQSNKYNYNYWSSPVGTLSTTANNVAYTVGGVLKDGTTPATPAAITWVTGNDGSPTTPISLASKWIFKFDNAINDYANWTRIYETGTVPVGQGFTLKGSGAATATQNLTFVGKPNNGNITSTVGATQLLLVGNPYPSALDANAFIADNATSIDTTTPASTDGALYFWEHYASNNSHNLSAYQGGYAVRNAASGVPPSSVGVDFINTSGASTRLAPNQYIPVGQGFFVIGDADGGTVTFKNSQRAFVKEDNAASQITYRIPTKPKGLDHWTDTTDDITAKDTYKRVRLGFNNKNEVFHRQVVVAFMDDRANGEINPGYDAENIDDVPNDMFLINSDKELIIEGEGYFDETASYPIGVRSDSEGVVTFIVDGLENFDANQPVFIYDDQTQTYHDIRTEPYEVTLPEGENTTRFALRFTDKALGIMENNASNDINVNYARASSILSINNNITAVTVEKVILYNLLGQSLASYKVENQEQSNIKIPIKGMPAGVYIAKVKTSKGVLNKKFIVK